MQGRQSIDLNDINLLTGVLKEIAESLSTDYRPDNLLEYINFYQVKDQVMQHTAALWEQLHNSGKYADKSFVNERINDIVVALHEYQTSSSDQKSRASFDHLTKQLIHTAVSLKSISIKVNQEAIQKEIDKGRVNAKAVEEFNLQQAKTLYCDSLEKLKNVLQQIVTLNEINLSERNEIINQLNGNLKKLQDALLSSPIRNTMMDIEMRQHIAKTATKTTKIPFWDQKSEYFGYWDEQVNEEPDHGVRKKYSKQVDNSLNHLKMNSADDYAAYMTLSSEIEKTIEKIGDINHECNPQNQCLDKLKKLLNKLNLDHIKNMKQLNGYREYKGGFNTLPKIRDQLILAVLKNQASPQIIFSILKKMKGSSQFIKPYFAKAWCQVNGVDEAYAQGGLHQLLSHVWESEKQSMPGTLQRAYGGSLFASDVSHAILRLFDGPTAMQVAQVNRSTLSSARKSGNTSG